MSKKASKETLTKLSEVLKESKKELGTKLIKVKLK